MNIQEFIDYNKVCPICDNDALSFTFMARDKQVIHRDSNQMIGIFDLKSTKKGQANFKFSINIDKINGDFSIDFYNYKEMNSTYEGQVPIFLVNRFKEYHKKLDRGLKFYKECLMCRGYSYQSQNFTLDLQSRRIDDISINWESWSFIYTNDDSNQQYTVRITNSKNKSNLYVLDHLTNKEFILRKVPLLKFSSLEEAVRKILLLKTFV